MKGSSPFIYSCVDINRPVAWYEAHIQSEEGLNMAGSSSSPLFLCSCLFHLSLPTSRVCLRTSIECIGATFPGVPFIIHGTSDNLGWAFTVLAAFPSPLLHPFDEKVNSPDLIDVYVMEINPDNEMQYKYDGEWKDLYVISSLSLHVSSHPSLLTCSEVYIDPLRIRFFSRFYWTYNQQILWSVYGPVVKYPHGPLLPSFSSSPSLMIIGVYSIRWVGIGGVKQVVFSYLLCSLSLTRFFSFSDL